MMSKPDEGSTLKRANPDDLKHIGFPSGTSIQPGWIRDHHPDYAQDAGMEHELTSERLAEHGGHRILITTTYAIVVDEHPVHLHLRVGNDGQLQCHSTPYTSYVSAMELVKKLIDRFPEAFENLGGDSSGDGQPTGEGNASVGEHVHGST